MKCNRYIIIGIVIALVGCSSSRDALIENEKIFRQGNYMKAHQEMQPLVQDQGDRNYPLYQLTDGTMLYALGNYNSGVEVFKSGAENLEADLNDASVAMDLVRRDDKSHYRGFDHERVLARYYTGLGYFQLEDYDNAIIAFRQALERDVDKEDMQEKSYLAIHFLLGESYLRSGDFNNASVAFRNAIKWDKNHAPAWYKLAYALHQQNRDAEAQEAYQKYKANADQPYLSIDGSSPYVYLLLDVGYGPYLKPDAFVGQFTTYTEWPYEEDSVAVSVGSRTMGSYEADNILAEARAEKRAAGEVTRKVASTAVKAAASKIPGVGLFVSGPSADTRKWKLLPGEIHIALVPAPEGPNDITLNYYGASGQELREYQQTFYYLPSKKEGENEVVYVRSGERIQNQNKKSR